MLCEKIFIREQISIVAKWKKVILSEFSAPLSLLYCALVHSFPTTLNTDVHVFGKAGREGELGPDLCLKNSW